LAFQDVAPLKALHLVGALFPGVGGHAALLTFGLRTASVGLCLGIPFTMSLRTSKRAERILFKNGASIISTFT
jgi:hypothetical protein